MAISAAEVKKLRDQTGAGMMDCKAALEEANGNFEEATTILRKKGLASAAKKAGRAASEGLIAHKVSADHSLGILAEVNCETDFVANTDDFKQLMRTILAEIEKAGDNASEALLKDPNGPIHPKVQELIGKLGENMGVTRFVRYAGKGHVVQYIHLGGKLGVQVEFSGVTPEIADKAEFKALTKEVAMQIAAASPTYVSRDAVPAELLDRERGIYRAQMENSGKPANVIEKIVEGKLGSFYEQTVLGDQPFVIRPEAKQTVSQVVAATNKAVGGSVAISRFARLKVGEGASA